ncbi:MAG: hypothetical protein WCF22_17220 [Candidatus Sulfotelmatobacter sp.]
MRLDTVGLTSIPRRVASGKNAHSHIPWHVAGSIAGIAALSLVGGMVLWAQAANPLQPPKVPTQKSSPALQTPPTPLTAQTQFNLLPALPLDGSAILHNLNEVISWYRNATTGVQSVGLPSDTIYQDNTKSLGEQAVGLAFQSAKAETTIITAQEKVGGNQPSGETTQEQNLGQLKAGWDVMASGWATGSALPARPAT